MTPIYHTFNTFTSSVYIVSLAYILVVLFRDIISYLLALSILIFIVCVLMDNFYCAEIVAESEKDEEETKKRKSMSLENRMRYYEDKHKHTVSKYDTFIVRIDGSNFRSVSKRFPSTVNNEKNPFDKYFVSAMARTASDLIAKFNCQTIYVHSDEISLIFAAVTTENDPEASKHEHIYGGRVEKIISLIPSYASVRFCHNLAEAINSETNEYVKVSYSKVIELLESSNIMFDGRLFTVPENYEVSNYLLWRSCNDCYRNCISGYAQAYESHKSLNNLTTKNRIKLLIEKHDINMIQVPQYLLYGTYIKKNENNEFVPFSIKIRCIDDVTNVILSKKLTTENIEKLQDDHLMFKWLTFDNNVVNIKQ